MKKTIISLFILCAVLGTPVFAHADVKTDTQIQLQQNLRNQIVSLLIQLIANLKAQLLVLQQQEAAQKMEVPPVANITPAPVTLNQPIITPPVQNPVDTSTPSIEDQSTPQIMPMPIVPVTPSMPETPIAAAPAPILPTAPIYIVNPVNTKLVNSGSVMTTVYSLTINNVTASTFNFNKLIFEFSGKVNPGREWFVKHDNWGNQICDFFKNDQDYVNSSRWGGLYRKQGIEVAFSNPEAIAVGKSATYDLKCLLNYYDAGDYITTTLTDNGAGQALSAVTITK